VNDVLRFTTGAALSLVLRAFWAGAGFMAAEYLFRHGRRALSWIGFTVSAGLVGWIIFELITANPVAGGG